MSVLSSLTLSPHTDHLHMSSVTETATGDVSVVITHLVSSHRSPPHVLSDRDSYRGRQCCHHSSCLHTQITTTCPQWQRQLQGMSVLSSLTLSPHTDHHDMSSVTETATGDVSVVITHLVSTHRSPRHVLSDRDSYRGCQCCHHSPCLHTQITTTCPQ